MRSVNRNFEEQSDQRKKLGNRGEREAEEYLQTKGYRILSRNFRMGRGEIDLICRKGMELVIVEVKSVRGHVYENGIERLTYRQQRKLIKTTYMYLANVAAFSPESVRFDVIVVDFCVFPVKIHHYEAAFWEY